MEYYEVLARRRMYRHFSTDPIPQDALDRILSSATRGPSAGFTQGFDFLILNDALSLGQFWSLALTDKWRKTTSMHKDLWNAPVVIIPLANPQAYAQRYSEPDKEYSNLDSEVNWPVPYWHIDTAFASMLILNSVVNENLGALFFGLFRNMNSIKEAFGIPEGLVPIGAIAIGHPSSSELSASSKRGRRPRSSQFHFNRF